MQKIINSCVCNLVCHAWLHHELIVSCKDALTVSILSWKETSQDWRWRRGWYIFICKFAVNAQPSRGNLKQVYDSLLVCMEFLLVWTLELVFHAILWDMVILRNNSSIMKVPLCKVDFTFEFDWVMDTSRICHKNSNDQSYVDHAIYLINYIGRMSPRYIVDIFVKIQAFRRYFYNWN